VCLFVALDIQHAMGMRHVVCGLSPLFSIFPRYLTNGVILKKKNVIGHKMCILRFSTTFVRNIFHSKKK